MLMTIQITGTAFSVRLTCISFRSFSAFASFTSQTYPKHWTKLTLLFQVLPIFHRPIFFFGSLSFIRICTHTTYVYTIAYTGTLCMFSGIRIPFIGDGFCFAVTFTITESRNTPHIRTHTGISLILQFSITIFIFHNSSE